LFDLISTVLNDTYIAVDGHLAYMRGGVKLQFKNFEFICLTYLSICFFLKE